MKKIIFVFALGVVLLPSLTGAQWNSPHQADAQQNIRYGAFIGVPKTLDPARSYSSDETQFLAQIYEPPLQYDYLKRPYTLVPLTAAQMPTVTYYNNQGEKLPANTPADKVAYSVYDIYLKPGIQYQPHPAFAKDQNGNYRYHHLTSEQIDRLRSLNDFKTTGTRELTADDYVYEIKRLAHPQVQSPIFGVMSKYIVGLPEYAKTLEKAYQQKMSIRNPHPYLNLRQYPLEGVKVLGLYHYQIKIKGVYPQFEYWLAMPFFAPIPWEADVFYSQPEMEEHNLSFDWHPVGTGPYMLTENNPNKQMVLARNPNFHHETYPTIGEASDVKKGYLKNAGQALPFVDKFVFTLDKESIPRWNKFLQGYYDKSGISADSYDQAIKIDANGQPVLSPELKKKGIQLQTTVQPGIFYIGFNMLDKMVGGNSERARKLRQAIAIAIDYEEYIAIFMNGRGKIAHGPIPPGIFGFREGESGMNEAVYFWDGKKIERKPLQEAKKLLAEAGYPNGIDSQTGQALILNYDTATTGNPDDSALFNWLRKQFAKLGITLNIRSTQYNRFQDKIRTGNAQIFSWGWLADYPDPENFLFLLYGPNGKVKYGGENATNYNNPRVDQLYEQIRNLPNGSQRQARVDELMRIIQVDAPWIWGVHPIEFTLSHQWNEKSKPHAIANNILKYEKLDPTARQIARHQWNEPIIWPIVVLVIFLLLLAIPLMIIYWRRENQSNIKRK